MSSLATEATAATPRVAPRDAGNWAARNPFADAAPAAPLAPGLRLVGPLQGFGSLWQKTFSVRLSGADVTPAEVMAVWKRRFAEFWPGDNRFDAPQAGLAPGAVALLDLEIAPLARLETGVAVLYADDTSFTLINPEGHMFAGWITFSAASEQGATVARVELLIRANDPAYELGLLLGGHAKEERFWEQTLRNLAASFGVAGAVQRHSICVDRRRQWRRAGNLRHNAFLRTQVTRLTALARRRAD
jgi:hypothetical protein